MFAIVGKDVNFFVGFDGLSVFHSGDLSFCKQIGESHTVKT